MCETCQAAQRDGVVSQETVNGRSGNRSGGILGLARKQIELWSSTAPSTSQGPRAVPGWWREVRGVAGQSEARKRVGLHTPHSVRGVSLCYTLSRKAAPALAPVAWVIGEWAGLKKRLPHSSRWMSGTFFPFFSRLTATSRACDFTKLVCSKVTENRGTGG